MTLACRVAARRPSRCAGASTACPLSWGAAMAGEPGLLVEDADAGIAGEQGQGLADVGVGDRVEIAVVPISARLREVHPR